MKARRREGVRTIYTVLRTIVRVFAWFIVLIVAIVAWRKLWVEDRALMALQSGELISLGVLLVIAIALWLFAHKIGREIDKV